MHARESEAIPDYRVHKTCHANTSMKCRTHCNSPPFHPQCIGVQLMHFVEGDCFVAPPHVPAWTPRNDGLNEKQSPDYSEHKA